MTNQLIRNIQIDLILGNNNPIIDIFNGIWNKLSVLKTNVYYNTGTEFIYYNENNEWLFFQDNSKDRFWCHYDRFWKVLKKELNIESDDVQLITKLLVENSLNNYIAKPMLRSIQLTTLEDCLIINRQKNTCV